MFVLAFYMKKFVILLKIPYGCHKLTKSYVFYTHVLVVTVKVIDINHIIINKKAYILTTFVIKVYTICSLSSNP